MSENFFKQQRQPINPGEINGGDEDAGVDAMRAHLNASESASEPQGAPPPIVMKGKVPPQLRNLQNNQQSFQQPPFAEPQSFQQPQFNEFQQDAGLSEAQIMHQNAKRMMRPQTQQEQAQQQQFNPEFDPQQKTMQRFDPNDAKYGMFKDQNFEAVLRKLQPHANYEEIELPSRGKFYTRGEGPSNGVLHIRKMTGREEQILYTPRYVKQNQALNMVFKECIGEQINPDLLLSEDRTYIMIYLRMISYSPLYEVEIQCPSCTKPFQTQIDLNTLMVDYCPNEFGVNDLNDVLPSSGLRVRYRLATGRDDTVVTEYRDNRIKQWGDRVADDTMLYRSALLIDEIEGVTNKTQIMHILERLPINDMAYLRELLNEPPFGVDDKVGIICPHCAHEFETSMPMELGFFFPKPSLQKKKQLQE